jgi:integrase
MSDLAVIRNTAGPALPAHRRGRGSAAPLPIFSTGAKGGGLTRSTPPLRASLFRSAIGKTAQLTDRSMLRGDVWSMVRRRASRAGIDTAIGCHTFRATGITDYLTNGGRIEVAQHMAGHSNAKTTGLYDRRNDDIGVGEVGRIGI